MRLRLSRAAESDLEDAWRFTAERWDELQADTLLAEFEAKFRLLLRFPGLGRERNRLAPGLRSLPASSFVVFYQLHDGVLEIVRVVHGARDVEGLFRGEE